MTLAYTRDLQDLVFVYNALHGKFDIDPFDILKKNNTIAYAHGVIEGNLLSQPMYRLKIACSGFSFRVVALWRKIPVSVKSIAPIR